MAWGDARLGGDCSAVREQLQDVQQIQASHGAFAAILSVVTWGCPDFGGDSSSAQGRLTNVKQIQASDLAFAAIRGDGSLVAWGGGGAQHGGDCFAEKAGEAQNVQAIQVSLRAFAALCDGGCVASSHAVIPSIARTAVPCRSGHIQSSCGALAAILGDRSVVTWGNPRCGGDCGAVHEQLNDVQQIQASVDAFAAILGDGSVVT